MVCTTLETGTRTTYCASGCSHFPTPIVMIICSLAGRLAVYIFASGQSSILPLSYLPQDYVILEHRQSDSLSFHSKGALFSWRINPGRSMLSLLALDTMALLRQVTWLEQGKKWSFWNKGIV